MFSNDIVGSSPARTASATRTSVRLFAEGVPTGRRSRPRSGSTVGGENDCAAARARPLRPRGRQTAVTGMNVRLIYRRDRYLRGSDHVSFLQQGYPAVRFTEPHENFNHEHQDVRVENGVQFGDLLQFVDFEYVATWRG